MRGAGAAAGGGGGSALLALSALCAASAAHYVPSAPQNLTVTHVTSSEIHLSWSPPTTYTSPAFLDTALAKEQHTENQRAPESTTREHSIDSSSERAEQNDAPIPQNLLESPKTQIVTDEILPFPKYESPLRDWYKSDRRKYHDDYWVGGDNFEVRHRREIARGPHRHRKRRQETPSPKTERGDNSTGEARTHEPFELPKDVVKKSDPPKPKISGLIAYVLYYEQGMSRANASASAGVPTSEEIKNANIFLSDMRMADYSSATRNLTLLNMSGVLTKVVGFRLRGLQSLTPYKIWVRAFYNISLENVTSNDIVERLGPRSEPLYVLTDVRPPSAPIVLNLTCDQPAGILYLQWRQPMFYENSLDQYVVSLRKIPELQPRTRLTIPTNKNDIETTISVVVELVNSTQYEVIIYAVTLSVAKHHSLINGTETKPEVVSSASCQVHSEAMSPGGSYREPGHSASTLVLVTVAMSIVLVMLVLYFIACGCRSRVSKCITAAYSFLEEGGERGTRVLVKKPVVGCSPPRGRAGSVAGEPADAVPPAECAPGAGGRPPRMSSRAHPAVPARDFPRHVAALHADGDIGFSKEYEVVVSRSAALAHTSHHSHRPENRHKNRYLNITAYDHSRVCVSAGGQCGAAGCAGGAEALPCDYVNANFIDGMLPVLDAERKDYIRRKLKRRERPHSRQVSQKIAKPPPNLTEGIESAFLNIEFSGIVESEEQRDDTSSENSDDEQDSADHVFVELDGAPVRVKLEWLVWRRRYIATQGPTPATLPSFWRMVWQHRVHTLVMITNLVERGRRKCDMYWPCGGRGSSAEFGGVHVTLLHEDVRAAYTVRHLRVKFSGINESGSGKSVGGNSACDSDSRTIVQYHYTVWPDHGTPAHPLAVLPFVKAASGEPHTVLVHCSAGVGRTGTYIVLDAQLAQLRLTGTAAPLGFLCRARTQRNHLVQTEEQYVFVHDALLEHVRSGETAVGYERAAEYLAGLLAPISEEELRVLDIAKSTQSTNDLTCENGDAASLTSNTKSAVRCQNGGDDVSEAQSDVRSEVALQNGDSDSIDVSETEKRLSDATSMKDLTNGLENGSCDLKTSSTNGVPESNEVYDLAPNSSDTYSKKMQAYANMTQAEKEECRRANRAENYALLERMRSLAGRKQRCLGPPPENLLEKQYQLITRCCAEPGVSSRAPHNLEKNRPGGIVPSDISRVMLVPRPGVEGSEYVNASWVSGRRRLREYAVSQHPTPAAIPDLWRLLWDHTAQLVLVLSDPNDPECEIFWPTQEEPEFFAANFRASFISRETYVAYRKCERRVVTPQPDTDPAACYRRQESTECADDERLIPEHNVSPTPGQEAGYKFDRVELRLERLGSGSRDLAARKSIANGDLFASLTESRRSGPRSPRSPSKMSLKSFKLGSPTRFKFPDWSRGGAGTPPDTAPPPPPVAPAATVEEETEMRRPCYTFERVEKVPEDIARDRVIEVTNVSVHSLQDDYQLTVKLMRCSGWLEGDTVRYHPGRPDDNGFVHDIRAADTEQQREAATDKLTEPFRDSFALIEFVAGRQMEYKNGPVVVVDKYGGWRALSFCTLSAACGGARSPSAPPCEFRDPADDRADVYCWAALSANARASLSHRAPAHSHEALLAQYAALARYGRLLRTAPR